MQKLTFIFIIIFCLGGCSSPKIKYENNGYTANPDTEAKFLTKLEAKENNFSVIFFTNGFLSKEKIEVKVDNKVVFSDILETDRSFGLAKTLRINNRYDILIKDLNSGYAFKLKGKKNSKYKYIYISKDADSNSNYVINYSNKLQSFY